MFDVSIVLLTKNGLPVLAQTLAAIFAQKTSRTFEVVAVDSGSTDGTLELLARCPVRVKQIPPEEFNFGATRGLAYDLAQGELLLTLSQDAVPADAHWLEKMAKPFADPTVAAVRGGQTAPPGGVPFYWERVGRFYFLRSTARWKARYGLTFSNVNAALRKSIWTENRTGPVEMCEDKFLQKLWAARNLKFITALDAQVYHAHAYDLGGLIRRSENEGLGDRLCGATYSLWDACCDTLDAENWRLWVRGGLRGEIRTRAEILFPLVRPFFMWKGNRLNQKYVHGS